MFCAAKIVIILHSWNENTFRHVPLYFEMTFDLPIFVGCIDVI